MNQKLPTKVLRQSAAPVSHTPEGNIHSAAVVDDGARCRAAIEDRHGIAAAVDQFLADKRISAADHPAGTVDKDRIGIFGDPQGQIPIGFNELVIPPSERYGTAVDRDGPEIDCFRTDGKRAGDMGGTLRQFIGPFGLKSGNRNGEIRSSGNQRQVVDQVTIVDGSSIDGEVDDRPGIR